MCQNVQVVIRTVGERTTEFCTEAVASQVGKDAVAVVNEVPFARAVRRTFEIGYASGKAWTLAIDADVLVFPHAVETFLWQGERMPKRFFSLDCQVIDKIFGGPRAAGIHLYRTSLLSRAIDLIDEKTQTHRPESHIREVMWRAGFPTRWHRVVVGLHDFEQYRKDYYRKGFVHAQKHRVFLPALKQRWERFAPNDPDFAALLAGAADGIMQGGTAFTDNRKFNSTSLKRRVSLIPEREPLERSAWPNIGTIGKNWKLEREYYILDNMARRIIRQEAYARLSRKVRQFLRPLRPFVHLLRSLNTNRVR
jgi:hypothetical protein